MLRPFILGGQHRRAARQAFRRKSLEGCPERREAASLLDSLYCIFSGISSTVLFVLMTQLIRRRSVRNVYRYCTIWWNSTLAFLG